MIVEAYIFFNHVMYLRICSFLSWESAEMFVRTKLVISSLNYFKDIVSIASIFPFYDEGGDKYDMFLDKIISVEILNWPYI